MCGQNAPALRRAPCSVSSLHLVSMKASPNFALLLTLCLSPISSVVLDLLVSTSPPLNPNPTAIPQNDSTN